jgi:hypothetical protein
LPARPVEGEPEHREHREDAVGRLASAIGLPEQRDHDEVRERRKDLREVRETTPGSRDRRDQDQRIQDRREEQGSRIVPMWRQRVDHDREPHRAQEGSRPREQADVLERLESRLV